MPNFTDSWVEALQQFMAEGQVQNLNGMEMIMEAGDLPDAENGSHQLEDNTAYLFMDFVFSNQGGLEWGENSPVLGLHGSRSGFIRTDGGTALISNGNPFFARSMFFHAPGGEIFDLSADNTTEFLYQDSSMSDAVGMGNINSLGTIDGFRVPSFKGVNIENFDGGLTFDGNPDKIFFSECPIREVTEPGVTAFTLAGSANAQIVDFTGNYVKDVQSDTEVWRVEAGGEPAEVFQYKGTLHDSSFNPSNALVGPNASPTVEPFWVQDSHPVRDSGTVGELTQDQTTTQTVSISSVDTWYDITGTTILGNETERVEKQSEGVLKYVGSKNVNVQISINMSVAGANGDTYEVALAKNDTVEPASGTEVLAEGQNTQKAVGTSAIEDLNPNDTLSLKIRNKTGANDATIYSYIFNYMD